MAAQCRGRGKAGPGALMTSFGGSGAINNNATSGSASTARSTTGTSKSLYGKASGDGASDSNDSGSKSDYDYTIKGLRVTSLYKLLADRGINPEPTADEHTVRPFRPAVSLAGCHERPSRIP
ncbi:hypothetical protein Bbelb_049470 [Branchiostoma belcheri]|nr:hypothetical protein Bbelb_049470 [Branchiostoma belcheri]